MDRLHRPLYARHRVIFALAVAAALTYRHRRALAAAAARSTRSARRAIAAVDSASATAAALAADLAEYLRPSAASSAVSASASSAVSAPSTGGSGIPPRSLRRLLRIAASPDALVVLRALAGGAAREIVPTGGFSGPSSSSPGDPAITAADFIGSAITALDTPAGMRVASLLVGTAVREAVTTAVECDHKHRLDGTRHLGSETAPTHHWLDVLLAAGLSDRGRTLLVDLSSAVTRAAVPAFLEAQHHLQHQHPNHNHRSISGIHSPASAATSTTVGPSPTPSPLRRLRPVSAAVATPPTSHQRSPASFVAEAVSSGSPASKQLLATMLAVNRQANWMDRLTVLASRERGLVRDVVRTVASESIRAYLTTQADLRHGATESSPASSGASLPPAQASQPSSANSRGNACPAALRDSAHALPARSRTQSRSGIAGSGRSNSAYRGNEPTPLDSLWKLLVRSVADDARQAVRNYWNSPIPPQWLFL
jgi:hypothetical protein